MSIRSPSTLTRQSAPQLYRALRLGLVSLKASPQPATVHHSYANQNLQWDARQESSFAVPYHGQIFQVQLCLERHEISGDQRVIMFGRRIKPRSSAGSVNTQRATFNSTNVGPHGFYVRPQLLKRDLALPRALAAELPVGVLPFWHDRHIHIGDGSPRSILLNFLKVTAVMEEIKGMEASDLDQRFPAGPAFQVAEIQAVELIAEGKTLKVNRSVRERSAKLRELATDYFCKLSPDGRLHCAVDDWSPAIPVQGAIVEIHHDEALHEYPDDGRALTFEEALQFLAPLCPNCHRMLHSKPGGGRYTVAELKRLVQKQEHQHAA